MVVAGAIPSFFHDSISAETAGLSDVAAVEL
jgi:hypothetical protein